MTSDRASTKKPEAVIRELRVGDRIRDNDPRMYNGNRSLVVGAIAGEYVWADQNGQSAWRVRILKRRIYTDGKTRRTGFSLMLAE